MMSSSHPVYGWIIFVVGLVAILGLVVLLKSAISGILAIGKRPLPPAYTTYNEDLMDGVLWRWQWTKGQVTNIWCFCPDCDAQLVYDPRGARYNGEAHLICENCPSDGSLRAHDMKEPHAGRGRIVKTSLGRDEEEITAPVTREILRRIRTKAVPP